MTLESLRRGGGVVQQDGFLFTTTLENNIAYADPWAEEPRIERRQRHRAAAQLRRSACRPATTPWSASAACRSRAASASGWRSRAALMPRPAVMVFDDSTAAIDAATEQRIREALPEPRQGPRHHHHRPPAGVADARRPDPVPRRRPRSSSAAPMPSCWRSAGATGRCTICSSRRCDGLGMMRGAGRDRRGASPTSERGGRPPRAVVGSTRIEEEIFGRAFDTQIMRADLGLRAALPADDGDRGGGGADLHRDASSRSR